MNLHRATLQVRDIAPGWPLVKDDVPLGKEYVVDLDRLRMMKFRHRVDGRTVRLGCIWVVSPPPQGWLPGRAFRMKFLGEDE